MKKLRKDSHDTGIILITHDLGIVARFLRIRVLILYSGADRGVGRRVRRSIPRVRQHPYTMGLIRAVPKISELDRPAGGHRGPGAPIADEPPDMSRHFQPRCPYATDCCRKEVACADAGAPDGRCVRCFRVWWR